MTRKRSLTRNSRFWHTWSFTTYYPSTVFPRTLHERQQSTYPDLGPELRETHIIKVSFPYRLYPHSRGSEFSTIKCVGSVYDVHDYFSTKAQTLHTLHTLQKFMLEPVSKRRVGRKDKRMSILGRKTRLIVRRVIDDSNIHHPNTSTLVLRGVRSRQSTFVRVTGSRLTHSPDPKRPSRFENLLVRNNRPLSSEVRPGLLPRRTHLTISTPYPVRLPNSMKTIKTLRPNLTS